MLTFVGLGLYDERSVTVRGADAIEAADRCFAEFYTSTLTGSTVEALEATHDVTIEVRDRSGVEDDPSAILAAAENGETVFLTAGDPMISTTHVDLRLRAESRGIPTHVVHGTTAQTVASSLTGLQNYRFGPSTTLPFERSTSNEGVPDSVLNTVRENRGRGLHTIVYLDIDAERDAYLSGGQAASQLDSAGVDGLAIIVAGAGSDDPAVVASSLENLADGDLGPPLHLLVIPGALHPIEADALHELAGAPPRLLPDDRR